MDPWNPPIDPWNPQIDPWRPSPWIPSEPTPQPKPAEKPAVKPVERPVEIMEHKAYIFGYPDGSIRPENSITRAESLAMIGRLLELSMLDNSKPDFIDTESAWYNGSINAGVSRGLIKGYPDGTFKPNAGITRAEFVSIIASFADLNGNKVAYFTDIDSHWAEANIRKVYGSGYITGYPDGTFMPDDEITRAEAVVILNNVFDRSVDELGLSSVRTDVKRFTDLKQEDWYYYEMVEAAHTHDFFRKRGEEDWGKIK